ncbi:DUF2141 domain-containing protein [Paracoccus sp. Ld10]|uniref:DUF2141 domain-containing protein n=1 Tax=Paracoccus sp. Ld10 TaxID=649158 RepID=UPI0038643D6E
MQHCRRIGITALIAATALAAPAHAASIDVMVTGIPKDSGLLACSLHADPGGFPDGPGAAHAAASPHGGSAVCTFDGVAPGRYAVAVLHDANANGRLDTNVLGMPQERWGISVRPAPRLRPPRFDEAAFDMGDDPLRLQIKLRP